MSTPTPPTGQRHPALDLLARYSAITRAAWAARHELAGPRHLADEAAFLPAALSLQRTPVHPAPRRAMWVIMALFMAVLAWSWFGQVDVVAIAPGRLVVSERNKVVQPLEAAVVKAIRVRDGDRVAAGQVLIELDPTLAQADSQGVAQQAQAAADEAWRANALLQALKTGQRPSPPATSGAASPALLAQTQAEWADLASRSARLEAEATRRQAELATVDTGIQKLTTMLPLARQREADVAALVAQGFVANHAGQDRMRERIEIERDLATQTARRAEAEAALQESRQAKAALRAEAERTLSDRLAKATLDAAQLKQQGTKTAQREQLTQLTAPVAGTVQQLAVHTTGGVVTPAQALLVIVPDQARLNAEVIIENKDVGFVHPGQAVGIKLETFNFTRYGTLAATVQTVAQDAVADDKRGAIFPATVRLNQTTLTVDGRPMRLSPGMNLTAEIKTGKRRVIDFVLSPIQRTVQQSWGER